MLKNNTVYIKITYVKNKKSGLSCRWSARMLYPHLSSLCFCKIRRINGNGRWDSDWLLHVFLWFKDFKLTFFHPETCKSGFGHVVSTLAPCALENALRSSKKNPNRCKTATYYVNQILALNSLKYYHLCIH